jgi:predicted transcriptional regulator
MPAPFEGDELGRGLETLLGRAADVLSRGREELLRQSRIGKVKLFDLTQLRRERARWVLRLGEEVYRDLQAGKLARESLEKTFRRIEEMDERIAAKEAEVERIQRNQPDPPAAVRRRKRKQP